MTITGDPASLLQRDKNWSQFSHTAANPMKCNVLLWNAQLFLYAQYWHSLDASLMLFLSFASMKVCWGGKWCMLSSISKQIYCGQSRRCRCLGARAQSSQFVRRCSWQLHSQHAYWHYTHITSTVVSISIQKPIFDFPDWQGFLEDLLRSVKRVPSQIPE